MNGVDLYSTLWKLRTNPIAPSVDADGQPLDPALLHDTLDPCRDARLVRYYFDHYDWSWSRSFARLSRQHVFQQFNPPSDDPLLVVICGSGRTGRRSLANLILYKIHQHAGKAPLVVDVELPGRNQPENVKACAQLFIFAYARDHSTPARADLLAIYTQQTQGRPTGDRSYYATLFQILRQEIRPHCDRPIVLRVTGGDHYDTWETLYNSTRSLFSYVIVTTSYERYVAACRNALPDRINVVRAGALDCTTATAFLRERLADERIPGAPAALAPFSEEALDELFREGAVGQSVKLDIGYVKRILRHALEAHVEQLGIFVAQHGLETLRQRPAKELLVDAERIRASGREVNRGGR